MRSSPRSSFTIIELLIVIIIIGILAYTINFNFFNNNLELAADNLIKDIRYTESLALKDDKYQPFPKDSSANEQNRSKYWFKQWWQIMFSKFKEDNKWHYYYTVFTDQPYVTATSSSHNFSTYANLPNALWDVSIAKDQYNNKLMIGHCGVTQYPDCKDTAQRLDLTKTYGIKYVKFINFETTKRLLFDNFGNVFLTEGDSGDAGDINPLDKDKRVILTDIAKIQLCFDTSCSDKSPNNCIQVNITPTGYVYKSNCE